MKIEKVKCDICEKEFHKDKPMAYLHIILHTRPIGLENDNGYRFDICDSCGRKYEKALDDIIEEANRKIIQMRISTKSDRSQCESGSVVLCGNKKKKN